MIDGINDPYMMRCKKTMEKGVIGSEKDVMIFLDVHIRQPMEKLHLIMLLC